MNQQRYGEAIQAYDEAIRLDSNSTDAWYNKGNALKSLGRYDEAIQAYDRAIRLDPSSADAWRKKAAAFSASGRYDEAMQAFNEAVNISNEMEDAAHKNLSSKGYSISRSLSGGEVDSVSNGISVSEMVEDFGGKGSEG